MCSLIPLYIKSNDADKDMVTFAAIEFFSCALGNGLITLTSLLAGCYQSTDQTSDFLSQAVLWLLFAILYFPTGGHMNASLTAGAWAAGQINFLRALFYVLAQTAGCLFAMEFLRTTAPEGLHGYLIVGEPPYLEDGIWAAASWEMLCTVPLILVSLGCDLFDHYYVVASTLVVLLVRFTGASMDPLGAISTAYFAGDYSHQIEVYWRLGRTLPATPLGITSVASIELCINIATFPDKSEGVSRNYSELSSRNN